MLDSFGAISNVIKGSGPLAGPLSVVTVGGYVGSQWAKDFIPPFDEYVSWLCLVLIAAGVASAIYHMASRVMSARLPPPPPPGNALPIPDIHTSAPRRARVRRTKQTDNR